jgi:hypothetical protein
MTDKTDTEKPAPLQVGVNAYPTGWKAIEVGFCLALGACSGLAIFLKIAGQIQEWFA